MKNPILGARGFVSIGMAVAMSFLGLMAIGASSMMNASTKSTADGFSVQAAEAAAMAAQEQALAMLSRGQRPEGSFQRPNGSFTIASSAPTITVTGRAGDDVEVTHSFDTKFANDCVAFSCGQLKSDGKRLEGLQLNKSCLNTPQITHFQVDVAPYAGEMISEIQIADTNIWNTPQGSGVGTVLDVEDVALPANPVQRTTGDYIEFYSELEAGKEYVFRTWFADGTQISLSCEDSNQIIEDPTPGFSVSNGQILVDKNKDVEFEVLCAQMTYPGGVGHDDLRNHLVRNGVVDPQPLFGASSILEGELYAETTQSSVTYALKGSASYKGWNYNTYSTNTTQTKTLVNGNYPTPYWGGFGGSEAIRDCMGAYVDVDRQEMVLADNQVIVLFELGVDGAINPNTSMDYMDIAILMTIADTYSPVLTR